VHRDLRGDLTRRVTAMPSATTKRWSLGIDEEVVLVVVALPPYVGGCEELEIHRARRSIARRETVGQAEDFRRGHENLRRWCWVWLVFWRACGWFGLCNRDLHAQLPKLWAYWNLPTRGRLHQPTFRRKLLGPPRTGRAATPTRPVVPRPVLRAMARQAFNACVNANSKPGCAVAERVSAARMPV